MSKSSAMSMTQQEELEAMRYDMMEEELLRYEDSSFEEMMSERYSEFVHSFVTDCNIYGRGDKVHEWFTKLLDREV